eukprot:GHVS01063961.1.p1 GENE.GHVS01063961.1~~GHVS01063961.1.p1  ORF type:complete len:518 (+),score=35.66 GHVS01063961.1:187-1740(+)
MASEASIATSRSAALLCPDGNAGIEDADREAKPLRFGSEETAMDPSKFSHIQWVLNVVSAIEGLDVQLLNSSSSVLMVYYHMDLTQVSQLIVGQSVAQALFGIFWGYLADSFSRVKILSFGCFSWGVIAMACSVASGFRQLLVLRVLNGIAIASIGPVGQSLVADVYPSSERGQHYGCIQMFIMAGHILGLMLGTSFAGKQAGWGIMGWSVLFFVSGLISAIIGGLVPFVAKEPYREMAGDCYSNQRGNEVMKDCLRFWRAAASRTFCILTLQGICGNVTLFAFNYTTMWFQNLDMAGYRAGALTSMLLAGGMAGSLFGGWLGDYSQNHWHRYSGRAFVGQLGTFVAIPLIYISLIGIPRKPAYFAAFAVVLFLLGFVTSWCASGANRPVLCEIVHPDERATVFGIQGALQSGIGAAIASPTITTMAESLYGFNSRQIGPGVAPVDRQRNINALGNALLIATAFPWTICFFLYGLMHFTYASDALRIKRHMLAERAAHLEETFSDDEGKNVVSRRET